MKKFWELLGESVLIRGTLALAGIGAIIYLACTGQEIPPVLGNLEMAIVGFYFGVESAKQAYKARMGK